MIAIEKLAVVVAAAEIGEWIAKMNEEPIIKNDDDARPMRRIPDRDRLGPSLRNERDRPPARTDGGDWRSATKSQEMPKRTDVLRLGQMQGMKKQMTIHSLLMVMNGRPSSVDKLVPNQHCINNTCC
ncbi:uncharacterized protein LOC113378253 [Ctenocephalides felis]|uniref:uncharacterized protein LOC113378253 n=1 Tax=Ctenocephalides felis TaxID=7515 RepID=UPI000E6E33E9|nr:uncharacterized protein LOC113378253 [Ctenocephalides felis]